MIHYTLNKVKNYFIIKERYNQERYKYFFNSFKSRWINKDKPIIWNYNRTLNKYNNKKNLY